MSRLRPFLPLFLLAVAAGAVLVARAERRRPNVVVITLDTLRPDAVGPGRGTPALDEFFRRARRFPKARTVTPLTLPSHVSLFSGLLPAAHGTHDNVTPRLADPEERGYTLLAEELAQVGYDTAAFVARGVLAPEAGLNAGFDIYESPPRIDGEDYSYVPAEERIRTPLRWLQERGDKPFFLWVHLFDPHAPRYPFPGDARRAPTPPRPNERQLYAGEVRRTDAAVEKLLAALDEDTIVVIASDHGEGLGEHGEMTHGSLVFATTIDMLLAVRGPGMDDGSLGDGPRSICDVAPTLRRWCRLPERRSDGLPLTGPPHDVVVAESLFTWRIHGWGQCFAAYDGRYTLVEAGASLQLFDRERDPGETAPIDPEGHPAYERLDRAIHGLRSRAVDRGIEHAVYESVAPYAEIRRPFSRYLSRAENTVLPDPKDLIHLFDEIGAYPMIVARAIESRDVPGIRRALRELEAMAEKVPTSPLPHLFRSFALAQLSFLTGDHDLLREAAVAQRRVVERGLFSDLVVREAVQLGARAGAPEEALRVLQLCVENGFRPSVDCAQAIVDFASSRSLADEPELRTAALELVTRCLDAERNPGRRARLQSWVRSIQ